MSSPRQPSADAADRPVEKKKPYRSPELFVYGDLRELTSANVVGKKNDGAMGKKMFPNKTFI